MRRYARVVALAIPALLGAALLCGCPSTGKEDPKVRYEVRELTPAEKEAKRQKMKGNRHTQAQLFRDLERLKRPARGR